MQHLGIDGYLELTRRTLDNAESNGNTRVIDAHLVDPRECVAEVGGLRARDRSTSYATAVISGKTGKRLPSRSGSAYTTR